MSDGPYRFLLRMPQPLREQLRAAAEHNGRSLNGEIVKRLEQGLEPDAGAPSRLRPGVLATAAAALTLAVSAGVAGFVAGEAGSPAPQGGDAGPRASTYRAGGLAWVRSGDFDPAARSAKS